MQKDYSKVSEITGENSLKHKPKYVLPIIKFNGKDGYFSKYNPETSEDEKLSGEEIKGVMLKHRRVYSTFTDEASYFTNEHNSWKNRINLFERKQVKDDWKVTLIDEGIAKDIKEKMPKLKMTQVIYFWLLETNEIVKLNVKGKGLSNLFDFFKEFSADDYIWQNIVKVSFREEESKLGRYYAMTFTKEDKVEDIDLAIEKIQEVAGKIEEVDAYYADFTPEGEVKIDIKKEKTDDIPIIEADDSGGYTKKELDRTKELLKENDEIDVKDIPF